MKKYAGFSGTISTKLSILAKRRTVKATSLALSVSLMGATALAQTCRPPANMTVGDGAVGLPAVQMLQIGPSVAFFNGSVFAAFQKYGTSNEIYIMSSSNTNSWTTPVYTGLQSGSGTALAAFNGKLYLALQQNNSNHDLFFASSTNGTTFTATDYSNIKLGGVPALAVFNNRLYLAFQSNDSSHTLSLTSTADGSTFSPVTTFSGLNSGAPYSIAAFNGKLYVAFQQNNSSHNLFISVSTDGVNFTTTNEQIAIGGGPSITTWNGCLEVAFQQNNSNHDMWIAASSDGVGWITQEYTGTHLNTIPAAIGVTYPSTGNTFLEVYSQSAPSTGYNPDMLNSWNE
jgi:hypothetical protein